MKVLHFYKVSYPNSRGGVESFIHQLAVGGLSKGVESNVLSISANHSGSLQKIDGYQIYQAPISFEFASTRFSFSALAKFKQLAASADIIHYHFPWPFMDIAHFLCGIKNKTVVSYHSDIIKQKKLLHLYKPLRDIFLKDVNVIVASSSNYLASSDVLKKHANKVKVIPYGLDASLYPKISLIKTEEYKSKFGEKFFLFLGVLRYYKGLHTLIEASKDLDFPIVIAGSGPLEAELKTKVQQLGLKHVHFTGFVSEEEKVALLQSCYAMIFPSDLRSEAFGISLLEASMYGKPMISCEIGTGTTFVNIDGITGLTIKPSCAIALKQAMTTLWENQGMAKEMGRNAKVRFQNEFTAKQMVSSYLTLYEELLGRE